MAPPPSSHFSDEESAAYLARVLGSEESARRLRKDYVASKRKFLNLLSSVGKLRAAHSAVGPLSYEYLLSMAAALKLVEYGSQLIAEMHERNVEMTPESLSYVLYVMVVAGKDPTPLYSTLRGNGQYPTGVGQRAMLAYWEKTCNFEAAKELMDALIAENAASSFTCCVYLRCCRSVAHACSLIPTLPFDVADKKGGQVEFALLYLCDRDRDAARAQRILSAMHRPVAKHFNLVALIYLKQKNWRRVLRTLNLMKKRKVEMDVRTISVCYSGMSLDLTHLMKLDDPSRTEQRIIRLKKEAAELYRHSLMTDTFRHSQYLYGGYIEFCSVFGNLSIAEEVRAEQKRNGVKETSRFLELYAACEATHRRTQTPPPSSHFSDEESAAYLARVLGSEESARRLRKDYVASKQKFLNLLSSVGKLRAAHSAVGPLSYEYLLSLAAALKLVEYGLQLIAEMHEQSVEMTPESLSYELYLMVVAGKDPTPLYSTLRGNGQYPTGVGQRAMLAYWEKTRNFDAAKELMDALIAENAASSFTCCVYLRCCRSVAHARSLIPTLPFDVADNKGGQVEFALLYLCGRYQSAARAQRILYAMHKPVAKHFNLVALIYLKQKNWKRVLRTLNLMKKRKVEMDVRTISVCYSGMSLKLAHFMKLDDPSRRTEQRISHLKKEAAELYRHSLMTDTFRHSQYLYEGYIEYCSVSGNLSIAEEVRAEQKRNGVKETSRFLELYAACEATHKNLH